MVGDPVSAAFVTAHDRLLSLFPHALPAMADGHRRDSGAWQCNPVCRDQFDRYGWFPDDLRRQATLELEKDRSYGLIWGNRTLVPGPESLAYLPAYRHAYRLSGRRADPVKRKPP